MNVDYMKNMSLLHCLTKMIFRVCFVFEGLSGLFFFGIFSTSKNIFFIFLIFCRKYAIFNNLYIA